MLVPQPSGDVQPVLARPGVRRVRGAGEGGGGGGDHGRVSDAGVFVCLRTTVLLGSAGSCRYQRFDLSTNIVL